MDREPDPQLPEDNQEEKKKRREKMKQSIEKQKQKNSGRLFQLHIFFK